jgi:branched-chain amino acid transport system ATP-binding protein
MLKAISGLIKVRAGQISLEGVPLVGRSPREILSLGVVHVPQDRSLFPSMTVWENVIMGAFIIRDRSLVHQRLAEVAEKYPIITKHRHKKAGALSGGEQRIIEFARAMMLDPKVILLDEPSLGLDPKTRALVFETVRTLADDGRAVLMVEQNARSGLAASHFGAVLDLGVVRLQGRAELLLDNPEVARLYLGASAAHHRRMQALDKKVI